MSLAIVAAWGIILTHADSPYAVRFVLFCSTDSCTGNQSALDTYAHQVQDFYKIQLGRTFYYGGVSVIHGTHPSAYYGNGNFSSEATWHNVANEPNVAVDGFKTVVMLGFHSMSNCGIAAENGPVAIGDPLYGCSNIESSVLAHELGHTFGLDPFSGDYHTRDGSLMNTPLACGGRPLNTCSITGSERDWLLQNRGYWFQLGAPQTSIIQGTKVIIGQGNTYSDPGAGPPSGVAIVYSCCSTTSAAAQTSNPFTFSALPQGKHRLALYNIPSGWSAVGYTLCYDTTNCHNSAPTALEPNPDSNKYHGLLSVQIDTTNHKFADIYFYFRDNQPPSTPTNLRVTNRGLSTTSIAWDASTDNVGVTGYKVYRNGAHIATTTTPTFTDSVSSIISSYNYTVVAFDQAGNTSPQSATLASGLLAPQPAKCKASDNCGANPAPTTN